MFLKMTMNQSTASLVTGQYIAFFDIVICDRFIHLTMKMVNLK